MSGIEFLTLALVFALATASPGPDFAMVTRNTLKYGLRAGVLTSVGIGCGLTVHLTYCVLGVGALMAQSLVLFSIVKWLGAVYLCYIGWQCLHAKRMPMQAASARENLPDGKAVVQGFLCNALNPKTSLFFVSLFSMVLSPQTSWGALAVYALYMVIYITLWFSLLAWVLERPALKRRLHACLHWIERGMGVVLMALGVRLAFAQAR